LDANKEKKIEKTLTRFRSC